MKTATLPSVRIEPEMRAEVESLLGDGETVSEFVEASVRASVLRRRHQAEFLARGQSSLENARRYTVCHAPLIETHRAELLAVARRRGMTGVRVFGSMSRGDARDGSDVDLLVALSPGTNALALGGLMLDAQELLGRRVDVVTEASLHPALRESVLAGAVPL